MIFTVEEVRRVIKYSQRIFFVSEFSPEGEVRSVLDYEATTEALNKIVQSVPSKSAYFNGIIQLQYEKLARAERALLRAGFEDLGGEEWKPPVNAAAGELFRLKEMLRRIVE